MMLDLTKPFQLNLRSPPVVIDFVETVETLRDDGRGSATPRKRPRRVHKKLAARGFAVGNGFTSGNRLSDIGKSPLGK